MVLLVDSRGDESMIASRELQLALIFLLIRADTISLPSGRN